MSRLDIKIEDLLPHRDRILLVDEIIEVDDKMAITGATVTAQWPFFDGKFVSSLILIELVAQTAGVSNGWVRMKKHGKDFEKKGWLVGVKQARFFVDMVSLHTRIITSAENQYEFESYRQILGTARIGSGVAGEISLQLIKTESPEIFAQE